MLAALPVAATSAQTLRGSAASVDLMYSSAHSHDLAFLKTRDDLYAAAASGALELITINDDLTLDKVAYPFVLPNTHRFADSLAKAYHAGCGERLAISSGARPMDEQPRNASPKSVHPTGMAIDIHKPAEPCLTWLRKNLLALEDAHVIEATEERHPPHFHVAVLKQLREPPFRVAASAAPTPAAKTVTAKSSGGKGRPMASSTGEVAVGSKQSTYKVRAGDNLWTIAERHNTTVDDLKRINHLTSTRLKVGTELKLP